MDIQDNTIPLIDEKTRKGDHYDKRLCKRNSLDYSIERTRRGQKKRKFYRIMKVILPML